ncbi:hypothetical protein M378DRAFT_860677 [Amanita muscaria Koide BX008]|uniref:Uncharacterized protein n=1 Tax=Amanita muscaria (strain Koide BX008) TaxID=946122 RepID=A0A0C2WWV0_AMAMK|nr:hypothetical protein M378DRAFT_860677 [Amanita muscaria Koide BX008]
MVKRCQPEGTVCPYIPGSIPMSKIVPPAHSDESEEVKLLLSESGGVNCLDAYHRNQLLEASRHHKINTQKLRELTNHTSERPVKKFR